MKKYVFTLLIGALLLMARPHPIFASETPIQQTTTVCYSDDLIVETALTIYGSNMQARATQSKSASKEVVIKNSVGNKLAVFTLYGTFTYSGSSATCTASSKSTSILDNTWHFTSSRAWMSTNHALGSYTLNCSATGQSISDNVTLTCSPTGVIS